MQSKCQNMTLGDVSHITKLAGYEFTKHIEYNDGEIIALRSLNVVDGQLDLSAVKYISKSVSDDLPRSKLFINDILLTYTGSKLGDTALIDENDKYHLAPNVCRLRANEDEDSYFLYVYLRSKVFSRVLDNFKVGSGQPTVPMKNIRQIPIPWPSNGIRSSIGLMYRSFNDKIELNRKMNETLEEMAQALFKSWFVDFDPVHARATCKSEVDLEATATKLGISKEILELFPSEFVESEMGMIPLGWEVTKIENILKRYRAPKRYKKDAVETYGKTAVLEQGADIILGYHDNDGEFEATEEEPMFIFGDHTCVMKLSTKPFSISENVIPLSGSVRNGYWTFYATYGRQSFQEYRRHWSELIVRHVTLPSSIVCDYFAKNIKTFVLKKEQNISENNELIRMRDTLLPKLLSGEIDVSTLEVE